MTISLDDTTHIDPLAAQQPFEYDDGVIRVCQLEQRWGRQDCAPMIARTPHFHVCTVGGRLEIRHWLRPDQIDNDLTGIVLGELFAPGLLSGNGMFERVFTGIIRSTVPEPIRAWSAFYANTLRRVRACWHHTDADMRPGSQITEMAPVYSRALRLVPPGRVLDLGSCFGFVPLLLAETRQHTVTASDVVAGSMDLLGAVARERGAPLTTLVCDAAAVPLPDNSFDTVTALHLIEHLPADHARAVLHEAVRLASKWVVVAVPFEDEPNPAYGHVQAFDARELRALGHEVGRPFTVSEYHGGWLLLDTE
ncbi:class I SAM-dependent methyltransferase [Hoyosella sp. YIM 151337]|uniref:mycofactocin oligosaccharide methyltransferase MftM n=1 Tax=Hoyosella sp. YIM 151337 TaxID=2992742 RepID=UPI0022362DD5|nr:mycofactocin oligosaccharide methyltransferase MftM [Hoyosella sp. YIM 151337]MCW4353594.1 class I SAM-dependent methyltransferase [Hoyosella sp. YIM 151337]